MTESDDCDETDKMGRTAEFERGISITTGRTLTHIHVHACTICSVSVVKFFCAVLACLGFGACTKGMWQTKSTLQTGMAFLAAV